MDRGIWLVLLRVATCCYVLLRTAKCCYVLLRHRMLRVVLCVDCGIYGSRSRLFGPFVKHDSIKFVLMYNNSQQCIVLFDFQSHKF